MKTLLSVKKIIALLLTLVFCVLSILGKITADQFMVVFTMVIGTYYSQSIAKGVMKDK